MFKVEEEFKKLVPSSRDKRYSAWRSTHHNDYDGHADAQREQNKKEDATKKVSPTTDAKKESSSSATAKVRPGTSSAATAGAKGQVVGRRPNTAQQWTYRESDPVLPLQLLTHEMARNDAELDHNDTEKKKASPKSIGTAEPNLPPHANTRGKYKKRSAAASAVSDDEDEGDAEEWYGAQASTFFGDEARKHELASAERLERRRRWKLHKDLSSSPDRNEAWGGNGVRRICQEREEEADLIETAPIWKRLTDRGTVTHGEELIASSDDEFSRFEKEAKQMWQSLQEMGQGDEREREETRDREIHKRFLPPALFDTFKVKEFAVRNVARADDCVDKMEETARKLKPLSELQEQTMERCVDNIIDAIGKFNDPSYYDTSSGDQDDIDLQRQRMKEKLGAKKNKDRHQSSGDEGSTARRRYQQRAGAFGAIGGALVSADDPPSYESNFVDIMDFVEQAKAIRAAPSGGRSRSRSSTTRRSLAESAIVWSDDSIDESDYTLENMLRPCLTLEEQLEKRRREKEAADTMRRKSHERANKLKQVKGKNWKLLSNVMKANLFMKETVNKHRQQISRATEASRERQLQKEKTTKERKAHLDSLREAAANNSFTGRAYHPLRTEYLGTGRSFAASEPVDDDSHSESEATSSTSGFLKPHRTRGTRTDRRSSIPSRPGSGRVCSRRPSEVASLAANVAENIMRSRRASISSTPTEEEKRTGTPNQPPIHHAELPRFQIPNTRMNIFYVMMMKPENVERPQHATRIDVEIQNDTSQTVFVLFDFSESANVTVYPRTGEEYDYMQLCVEVPPFSKAVVARLVPFSRMDRWDPNITPSLVRNADDIADVKRRAKNHIEAPKRQKSLAVRLESDVLANAAVKKAQQDREQQEYDNKLKKGSTAYPGIFVEGAGELTDSFAVPGDTQLEADGKAAAATRRRKRLLQSVTILLPPKRDGEASGGEGNDEENKPTPFSDESGGSQKNQGQEEDSDDELEKLRQSIEQSKRLQRRNSQLMVREQLEENIRRTERFNEMMAPKPKPKEDESDSTQNTAPKKKKKHSRKEKTEGKEYLDSSTVPSSVSSRPSSQLLPPTPSSEQQEHHGSSSVASFLSGSGSDKDVSALGTASSRNEDDQREAPQEEQTTETVGGTTLSSSTKKNVLKSQPQERGQQNQQQQQQEHRRSSPASSSSGTHNTFASGLAPGVAIADEDEEERQLQAFMNSELFADSDASPKSTKMSPGDAAERRRRFYEQQEEMNRSHGIIGKGAMNGNSIDADDAIDAEEEEDNEVYEWGMSKYQQTTGGVAAAIAAGRRRRSHVGRSSSGGEVFPDEDTSGGEVGADGRGEHGGAPQAREGEDVFNDGDKGAVNATGATQRDAPGNGGREAAGLKKAQAATVKGRSAPGSSNSSGRKQQRSSAIEWRDEAREDDKPAPSTKAGHVQSGTQKTTQTTASTAKPTTVGGTTPSSSALRRTASSTSPQSGSISRYYQKELGQPKGGAMSTSPHTFGLQTPQTQRDYDTRDDHRYAEHQAKGGKFPGAPGRDQRALQQNDGEGTQLGRKSGGGIGSAIKAGALRSDERFANPSSRGNEEASGGRPMHEHGDFTTPGSQGKWRHDPRDEKGDGSTNNERPYYEKKLSQPKGRQWKIDDRFGRNAAATESSDREYQEHVREHVKQQEQRKVVADHLRSRINKKMASASTVDTEGKQQPREENQEQQRRKEPRQLFKTVEEENNKHGTAAPSTSKDSAVDADRKVTNNDDGTEENAVRDTAEEDDATAKKEFVQNPQVYVDHMDELMHGVLRELGEALGTDTGKSADSGSTKRRPQQKRGLVASATAAGDESGDVQQYSETDEPSRKMREEALQLIREAHQLARQQRDAVDRSMKEKQQLGEAALHAHSGVAREVTKDDSPFRIAKEASPQVRWREHDGTGQQNEESEQYYRRSSRIEEQDEGQPQQKEEQQRIASERSPVESGRRSPMQQPHQQQSPVLHHTRDETAKDQYDPTAVAPKGEARSNSPRESVLRARAAYDILAMHVVQGWELQQHREVNIIKLLALLERKTGKRGFVQYFSEADSVYIDLPPYEQEMYGGGTNARSVGRSSFHAADGRTGVPISLLVAQSANEALLRSGGRHGASETPLQPTPPTMCALRIVEGLEITGAGRVSGKPAGKSEALETTPVAASRVAAHPPSASSSTTTRRQQQQQQQQHRTTPRTPARPTLRTGTFVR